MTTADLQSGWTKVLTAAALGAAVAATLGAATAADARPSNFFAFNPVSGGMPLCLQRAAQAVQSYGMEVPYRDATSVAGWSRNVHALVICVPRNGGVTAVISAAGDDGFDENAMRVRDFLAAQMNY